MTDAVQRLVTALAERYRIERELGAGGMATVYLAHDVRHDRKVALKVLRPELAAILGGERFLAEIKTTANLQHPHILPLHDSGEADGLVFYVMPYVEGESLRDRLTREHQLPVEDAVRIAREVLSALDYAHRHNVVHRDIKPENILLHDGSALVADFGIALAVSRSEGGTRMTETGMSLGTPHYMAPEQAMGEREITPKADIYAVGCVLYEMLTGEPPFTGPTAQAIVARVMTEEPRSLTLQRRTVPPHVEAVVRMALEKLPADRFASASEFSAALINPAATASRTAASASAIGDRQWRRVAVGAAAIAVVAAVLALWGWLRPRPEPPVTRYSLGLPADQGIEQGVLGVNIALSPDGRRIVYLGPGDRGGRLWLRDRSRLESTVMAGTEGASNPVFSPDGRQIAYSAGAAFTLRVAAVDGGPPVTLTEAGAGSGGGLAWSTDGWIYYDSPEGYRRIRANGGEPQLVVPLDTVHGQLGMAWPQVLPGGRRLLLRTRRNLNLDDFEIVAVDVATGRQHFLTKGLIARYVAPGYLVVLRSDGALSAVRFRPGDDTLHGSMTPLLQGVMTKPFGSADLALADDGTLLYVPGSGLSSAAGEVVWVTREGVATSLQPALTINPSARRALALSPDGARLVVDMVGPRSTDLWVKQLPSGPFSRLTFEGSENIRPSWTPDGRDIVFISDRDSQLAVWRQRADGSASAERLLRISRSILETQLAPDGRLLMYRVNGPPSAEAFGVRLGQDTTPVPLLTGRFNEYGVAISPDGAWVAYVSDESGSEEVYVRPFPRTGAGRWQVSTGGGNAPRWAHSGRELFYQSPAGDMMAVPVSSRPTFSAGEPKRLFSYGATTWPSNAVPYYDVSRDDRRFLMVRIGGTSQAPGGGQLVVIEHWFQELRAKVEAGQR